MAETLVSARREARAQTFDMGDWPSDLEQAYRLQDQASALFGNAVAGWKLGRVLGDDARRHGVNRFVGPIFAGTIIQTGSGPANFPAIEGGSSAFEAELLAVIDRAFDPRGTAWTAATAGARVSRWHIGVEIAGCPVPNIGDMGPLASICAFGNNLGLLVGPQLPDLPTAQLGMIGCTTQIDGVVAGQGRADLLPDGPCGALAFAFNHFAQSGMLVPAGSIFATGALTGVHPVSAGQSCIATFDGFGTVSCVVVGLRP